MDKSPDLSRRKFLTTMALGCVGTVLAGQTVVHISPLMPRVLYEPDRTFKIGDASQFPDGIHFLENERLFILRDQNKIWTVSAVCTHLGCTVKPVSVENAGAKLLTDKHEFHCPCHGSKFLGTGKNFYGPAPRSLVRYKIALAPEDGQLVIYKDIEVGEDYFLKV
jgi:menaquinol-cytochrome c reductase iron-sulfur subunit